MPGASPLTVWPSSPTAAGAWGAGGAGPRNPQDLNRYTYTLNNPLRYTDPTGHCGVGRGLGPRMCGDGAGMTFRGAPAGSRPSSKPEPAATASASGSAVAIARRALRAALNSATPILAATEGAVAASQGESLGDGLVKGGIAAAAALGGARIGGGITKFFATNSAGKSLEIVGGLFGEVAGSVLIQIGGQAVTGQKTSLGDVAATGFSVTSATTLNTIVGIEDAQWDWDSGTRLARGGLGLAIGMGTMGVGQGVKGIVEAYQPLP